MTVIWSITPQELCLFYSDYSYCSPLGFLHFHLFWDLTEQVTVSNKAARVKVVKTAECLPSCNLQHVPVYSAYLLYNTMNSSSPCNLLWASRNFSEELLSGQLVPILHLCSWLFLKKCYSLHLYLVHYICYFFRPPFQLVCINFIYCLFCQSLMQKDFSLK